MKNKIVVELCDKEYSLLWDETPEYAKSLALEMNRMINNMAFNNMRISKSDATVLTCLDLCDKNRKLSDNNDNMRKQVAMYIDEIAGLNKRLLVYERQKPPKDFKNFSLNGSEDDQFSFDSIPEKQNTNV